jgi:hypothetical protein
MNQINPNPGHKGYPKTLQPNTQLSVGHWSLGFVWTLDTLKSLKGFFGWKRFSKKIAA